MTVINLVSLLAGLIFPSALLAGMVQTVDQQRYDGSVQLGPTGTLIIDTTNGQHLTVPLEKIKVAQLGALLSTENELPKGWHWDEFGQVRGSAVEKDGQFTLQATGGTGKLGAQNHQAAFFAYRMMRADGEMVARMESFAGQAPAMAGVMARENLGTMSGFVLLGVGPGHRLHCQSREAGWLLLQKKDYGEVGFPIWLKLAWRERIVTTYRSTDGRSWEKLEQFKINFVPEGIPEGTGDWRTQVRAGLGVSAPYTNTLACARFDEVSFTTQGLMGQYFAEENFQNLAFARPDDKIHCWWGNSSPYQELPSSHYSIRWIGQLEPKNSGPYRFAFKTPGVGKLWVEGQELAQAGLRDAKDKVKGQELPLQAGRKYDFRFDYQVIEGPADIKLEWKPGEVIPPEQMSYHYDANSPEGYGEGGRTNDFATRGLWLRSGTVLAGGVRSADALFTKVRFAGTNELTILNSKIARIVFRKSARPLAFEPSTSQTGVLLRNGDFVESEFRGINDRALTVTSVLFGKRTFSLENAELIALVLNGYAPQPARFEVRLLDGSVLRARSLRAEASGAQVDDMTLGEVTIPAKELLEIRKQL